jgi:hypothetical protein
MCGKREVKLFHLFGMRNQGEKKTWKKEERECGER